MEIKQKNPFFLTKNRVLILTMRVFIFLFLTSSFGATLNDNYKTPVAIIQESINGTILDTNGQPLPGVNILEKGTPNGTQTDFDGNFSITLSSSEAILVVSYIGYKTKEVAAKDQTSLTITLEEDVSALEEVVVVGFGTQNKQKVSAAITQVSSEDLGIEKRPVTNVASALIGSMPGLNSTNSEGGSPGTNPTFSIRGTGTTNDSEVLVIIDNFEGTLADVNPQEIESATILKDAAAVAIYGARGANGVLLITTKKTKKGERISVSYNYSNSIQSKGTLPDVTNAQEYVTLSNIAQPNAFSDEVVQLAESGFYPDTNWADAIYGGTAMQQSHNLSLRGGTENTGFLMSVGYLNQDGLAIGDDNFERLNLRLKIDVDVTDWLTVGTNTLITNRITNSVPISTGTNLLGSPFIPVTTEDGYWADSFAGVANPVALASSGSFTKTERDNLNLQLYARVTPLKGLSLEQSVSILKNNTSYRDWDNTYEYVTLDIEDIDSYTNPDSTNRTYVPAEDDARTLTLYSTTSHTITALTKLSYEFNINNDHNFSTLLGFQAIEYEGEGFAASRQGFALDDPVDLILGEENATVALFETGNQELGNTSYFENTATLSYFGRLNYDYKGRYIIEGSFRYDGSSYFATNNRWGFFPSASVAWNMKSETFMKEANWIDRLKLRASYGLAGDDSGVGAKTIQLVDYDASGGYPIGNESNPGYTLGDYANPDLKWETSKIFNAGLDFSLWQGKFQISADYFINNREDILDDAQVAEEFGFGGGEVASNLYAVKSWGWELDFTHKNKIGKDFSYWVNANLSDYDNEITDLNGYDSVDFAVGQSINNRIGYETDNFFDSQDEIDSYATADGTLIDQSAVNGSYVGGFKFVDQLTSDSDGDGVMDTGDGVINSDDRVVIEENNATNYRFGFNLGFDYKKLSVSARFYGAFYRNQYWNSSTSANQPFIGQNTFSYFNNYWREDNQDAFFPVYSGNGTQDYQSNVSHFIRDNEFIKMQNLTVGYDLTEAVSASFKGIKAVSLNLSFENLGVIWTNSPLYEYGWDPEVATGTYSYPLPFTTSVGLNITF